MPPNAWKVVKKEPEDGDAPPQTAFPDLASAQQVANTRRIRSNARTFWNSTENGANSSVQRTRVDELNSRVSRWRQNGRAARDIVFRDDLRDLPESSSDVTLEEEDRRASITSIRIYDKTQNSGLGVWASVFQPPADPLRTELESSRRKAGRNVPEIFRFEETAYQNVHDPAEIRDCPTLSDLENCLAQCTRTHRADALERKQGSSHAFDPFFDMVEVCIASPVMLYRVSLRGKFPNSAAIIFIQSATKKLPADIQYRFRRLIHSALASNATNLAAAGAGQDPLHGIVQYDSHEPNVYPSLTSCTLLAIELCDLDDSQMVEQLASALHTESWKSDTDLSTYNTTRLARLATQLSRAISWSIGQHYYAETAPQAIPIAADSGLRHLLVTLEYIWKCNMRRPRGERCELASFYSSATELPFIINDYQQWIRSSSIQADLLYFCNWPYTLTIGAKVQIFAWEARQALRQASTYAWLQPSSSAQRRSQVTRGIQIAEGNPPPPMPYYHDQGVLSVNIRRTHIIEDSLFLLDLDAKQLYQPMKVTFDGEIAQDAGGIQKEFLLLLCDALCDPNRLFSDIGEAPYEGVLWFSPHLPLSGLDESSETYRRIELLGLTLGMALVSGVTLNVNFPRFLFEYLLNETVGIMEMHYDLDTLRTIRPSLAASLTHLLNYDESNGVSVEDAMRLSWTIPYGDQTHCLASEPYPVTALNRAEYVSAVCVWMLRDAVRQPLYALACGFARIAAPPVSLTKSPLHLLQAEELETLLRGRDEHMLDVDALRASTTHVGFPVTDSNYAEKVSSNLENFWSIWKFLDAKSQHALLGYITGSPRVPAMGTSSIGLRIQHVDDVSSILGTDRIPWSSTCTSTLFLPVYESRHALESKLRIALQHSVGFGLA